VNLALPAEAWNATGHRVIAAIAYDRLTPGTRARVDELIRRHPDYARFTTPAASGARAAFIAASVWADQIRSDPRFYDESRASATVRPPLAGYPSMARHAAWHYFHLPFTTDGTLLQEQAPPHALSEIQRLLSEIGASADSAQTPSYGLVWILHLIGDIHEPLHCASRFLESQPRGDAGGNLVLVRPGRTLHSFWDNLPGSNADDVDLAEEVAAQSNESPGDRASWISSWVKESFALAQRNVYQFGNLTGSSEFPISFPRGYEQSARRLARLQLAKAGVRLALVLNSEFP